METSANYITGEKMYFSSDERKWITKIRKLKEAHPEEVNIIRNPEENDGCIYCSLPAQWLKISPKRSMNLTEEQRAEIAERLRSFREKDADET